MAPPVHVFIYTWAHPWISIKSFTCKSACLNHGGVTTMERLDQGYLHLILLHPRQTWPGRPEFVPRTSFTVAQKSFSNLRTSAQHIIADYCLFGTSRIEKKNRSMNAVTKQGEFTLIRYFRWIKVRLEVLDQLKYCKRWPMWGGEYDSDIIGWGLAARLGRRSCILLGTMIE
jgi:hypothetical protein